MSAGDHRPDGDWFAQMADASGLMFFVLRVRPDVALEFVNDAPGAVLIGERTDSGGATDADATNLLGQIDPDYADRLSAVLALPRAVARRSS